MPVHLYTAETLPGEDAWRGWRDLVGAGSELHPVGGSHQTIMQPPRLNQIADSVTGYLLPASHTPGVIIQRGSQSVPPLFCLPGAGASASSFIELALALPSHLPVHALQARGLTAPELPPFISVEEAARSYIQVIRQTQSEGPWHLLGHSFGGWIAFEMALQLQAQGENIGALILVDTNSPDPQNIIQKTVDQTEALLKLTDIYNMMLPHTLPLTRHDFIGLEPCEQIELLSETLIKVGFFPANAPLSLLQGIVQVMHANLNTIYIPRTCYQGLLHLINAEEGDNDETSLDIQNWKIHATQLNTTFVPGNHMTMLSEPNVRKLAEGLTKKIKI